VQLRVKINLIVIGNLGNYFLLLKFKDLEKLALLTVFLEVILSHHFLSLFIYKILNNYLNIIIYPH